MDRVSAPDRLGRRLAQSEMTDLALLDQLPHRSHRLLDLDVRVDAVLVVEVDVIGAEPLQGAFHRAADMLCRAVERADRRHLARLRRRLDPPCELGRDHVFVSMPLDRTADELLVGHRPVQLCGIQEADPELQRTPDGRDRLAFVSGPVEGRHAHASKPEGGYLERSKLALSHCCSNLR